MHFGHPHTARLLFTHLLCCLHLPHRSRSTRLPTRRLQYCMCCCQDTSCLCRSSSSKRAHSCITDASSNRTERPELIPLLCHYVGRYSETSFFPLLSSAQGLGPCRQLNLVPAMRPRASSSARALSSASSSCATMQVASVLSDVAAQHALLLTALVFF